MSNLKRLLNPRSIAVVGGGAWCEAVLTQCQKAGFAGSLHAVHKTRSDIVGVCAVPTVEDLPMSPDATFIGVNRQATIGVVESLSKIGAGGAICFASGFSEASDGGALNKALLEAGGDLAILGPNCYGFLNYFNKAMLWPDVHGGESVEKGVAIIAQSSNVALNLTMQNRSLPIGMLATVGNQAKTSIADIGLEMIHDPRITALGLYVEGFGNIRAIERLAHAANEANKPIVVIKTGQSEAAQSAAISHTASLTGSNAGADALMRRLGLIRVESLPVFLEALKLAHVHGFLSGHKIASLSCSGGEASLMADAGARAGVEFPAPCKAQKEMLKAHLSDLVSLTNPLDYHTFIWRNRGAMTHTFCAMAGPDIDLVVVVLDFPKNEADHDDWLVTLEAIEDAAHRSDTNFAVLASLPENMPVYVSKRLIKNGILPLCGIDEALTAVKSLGRSAVLPDAMKEICLGGAPEDTKVLTEAEAKASLAKFGLDCPKSEKAASPDETIIAAQTIGYPVVLKGVGFEHKTEAGAVATNLKDQESLSNAVSSMPVSDFLVEEMITDNLIELLVGVTHDPAHGYVLTLAAGGVLTEIMKDSQSLLLPVNEEMIDEALDRLKIVPVINGYRGKPAISKAAVHKAVLAIQAYVIENLGKIAEVEVNPLICNEHRAVAADALIRIGRKK